MGAIGLPARPLLSTRGVQHGDPLGHFLLAAGFQAALDALPQVGPLHRLYLDDGFFLGSVAEVDVVLGALRQTLPPLGMELNLRKTTVWGPGLVHASSPLTSATRLYLEEDMEVLVVPIHSSVYYALVGTHLGTLKGTFARTCAAVTALADTQCAHALMLSCPGTPKLQHALRTLPLRYTASFAADVTVTKRASWDAVVGKPTSHAAWVQTTLPMSECGCGVASAADVAPVARLAGSCSSSPGRSSSWGMNGNWSCPWPPRRDCLTPSIRACPRPWNHWQVGPGPVNLNCQTGMSDARTVAVALLEAATGWDVLRFVAQRAGKAGG